MISSGAFPSPTNELKQGDLRKWNKLRDKTVERNELTIVYIDGIIGRNEPRFPTSNHLTITLFSKLLEEGELFSLNHGSWTETGEL
jgi:hypothetical protein